MENRERKDKGKEKKTKDQFTELGMRKNLADVKILNQLTS
jgi:hypothetical protein